MEGTYKFVNAPTLAGFEPGVEIEYIGRTPQFFYAITVPHQYREYKSFRLWVSPWMEIPAHEVAISDVRRYRDGGTTDVITKLGTFHFPNAIGSDDRQATLDGNPIEWFNPR